MYLTTNMDEQDAAPYFLWDDPISIRELHERLRMASEPERLRLIGTIMREANDAEVWRFVSLGEVLRLWPKLVPHLGRRRAFWEFILGEWRRQGLIP